MGLKLRGTSCSIWRTAFLVSALTVSAGTAVPDRAYAEGFLDFLFGGFQRPSLPPAAPPPTPTVGRVAPPALGHESVSGISSIGRTVGYCVRLCDGQHFPIGQIVYGTPEDTCTAICPYSKTKLFFGSEIRSASAKDGQHYIELESAFLYRKELVANCTCNGRDPFGLAPLGVKNDPTLRQGDLVSTAKNSWPLAANLPKEVCFSPPSIRQCFLPICGLRHRSSIFLRLRSRLARQCQERTCRQGAGEVQWPDMSACRRACYSVFHAVVDCATSRRRRVCPARSSGRCVHGSA